MFLGCNTSILLLKAALCIRGLLECLLLSNRMALARVSGTVSRHFSTSLLPSLRVAHETVRELDITLTTGKSMKPKPQRLASPVSSCLLMKLYRV